MFTLDSNKKAILERIARFEDPAQKQIAMTAAQYLRQEGRQEGMLHVAKNMLSKLHLDIKAVKEATGLSEEELRKLQEEAKR